MARVARGISESGIYHIVFRGNGRQQLFMSDEDRVVMLKLLKRSSEKEGVEVIAWCLMDNHVHLVLRDEAGRLSACMHVLLTGYARYFNQKYGHVGHVFQERFSSFSIEDDRYLVTVLRYVHLNPQLAGMCAASAYRWSSYGEYTGRSDASYPRIAHTEVVLNLLGGAEGFAELCRSSASSGANVMAYEACMGEDEARVLAASVLSGAGAGTVDEIAQYDKARRNRALSLLLNAGFSIRRLERMTGVGRGVIARAQASGDRDPVTS